MVNVIVERKSVPSTVTYEISYPTQDNPYDWVVDWSGAATSLYLGALLSAFEQAIDAERQKLELDITQEFEFADGEATLLIDETK